MLAGPGRHTIIELEEIKKLEKETGRQLKWKHYT